MTVPLIQPVDVPGDRRQHTLIRLVTGGISARLGFSPNVDEGDRRLSWGFTVDGERCGVWSSAAGPCSMGLWSAFGPLDKLVEVFGAEHVSLPRAI